MLLLAEAGDHPSLWMMALAIPLGLVGGVVCVLVFVRVFLTDRSSSSYAEDFDNDEGMITIENMTMEDAHQVVAAVRSGQFVISDPGERAVYDRAVQLVQHQRAPY